MKTILLTLSLILLGLNAGFAQLGVGTTNPKTTMQIEGKPTDVTVADGVIPPVLTLAQLDNKVTAYGTDQDGAIVYVNDVSAGSNTTETAEITVTGYYYYDASDDLWKSVGDSATNTYSIGDFAQGGVVFWVDNTGEHGLVAAKEDQSTGVRWFAGTYGFTQSKGAGIYAGKANTAIIIAAHAGIGDDANTYAARICNELQITENDQTYGDWYLPSRQELDLMYLTRSIINSTALANGGDSFANDTYWSSSENTNIFAWVQDFFNGVQNSFNNKDLAHRVRAIRSF